MRHQEVPASEANALYPGIGPSCTGNNITVSSVHHMKDKPYLTKRRGCPSDTWTVNQATGTSTHVHKQTISNQFPSLGNSELNRSDECYTETSVIAQPIFVFEKKERPFKRPAEDLVYKAENETFFAKKSTLIESAAAYISKPAQKYLLDKVEVITGEEAEHNVLQISCKLFVFNKLSLSWSERGRGSLRLNDTSSNKHGTLHSRLVMRNQGSLRLILNTKLWTQMAIERVNRKSLCITATDLEDHSVKVFLIQASSKDTEYLYAAIHHRLVAQRSFAEQELDANQVDTEPETAFHSLNCDSDDDDEEDETITQVSSNESGK
ncbi:Ran-binding protein 3-like protein [Chelonia mydas]|uniref:Ran-binding protein 3-like n=1 Tax=Chelonia mydas TaxID=8469 RepID=M7B455_CHEMY|nr:Ran-binding protein 3-like protein [Chelonia mydas]